jgi:ferric iron reductase protein FhuF
VNASEPSSGLKPAGTADVTAAIRRAGRDNPLLGIGLGPGLATGLSDATSAALVCHPQTATRAATDLIDEVGGWLQARERRVAASLVVLGYAARLVGPATAVLLRDSVLLDLRPHQVGYTFVPGRGFQLTLRHPTGWRGPDAALHRRWGQDIIDGHLHPVITAVRTVVPVAAGLLWGNVASGLTGALRTLARDHAAPAEACHRTGLALLHHPALAGTGHLTRHDDDLHFTRRSCCLYYRLGPTAGTCADCPLTPRGPTPRRPRPGPAPTR